MTHRERLPNRRQHELISFQHAGIHYVAGIGRFADGRLAEVFLNGAKCGTDADTSAKDAAIVASIALQSGAQLDTIRRALTRNRDGSAAGPLGCALDILTADQPMRVWIMMARSARYQARRRRPRRMAGGARIQSGPFPKDITKGFDGKVRPRKERRR